MYNICMKNVVFLILGLLIGVLSTFFYFKRNPSILTPAHPSSFYYTQNIQAEIVGTLKFVNGNEHDRNYIKTIDFNCFLDTKECSLLTANYVKYGKFPPDLKPEYTNCKVLDTQNKIITAKCDSADIKFDLIRKDITFTYPALGSAPPTVYYLKSD